MMFEPYIPVVVGPRASTASEGEANSAGVVPVPSVVHSVSRICPLGGIGPSGYEDFFMLHPYDGVVEAVFLSSLPEAQMSDFSVEIVQTNGGEETVRGGPFYIQTLTVSGVEVNLASRLGEGPVFLRMRSPAVAVSVLATIHIQTSEIE